MHIAELGFRTVALVKHHGDESTIEDTRRPLYRHMIMEELVGGPSMIRYHEDRLDLLVMTHEGYEGDEVCNVDHLPPGRYAVQDYEGPVAGLATARQKFMAEVAPLGPVGDLLQIHHMDDVDGVVEEQFQIFLGPQV